MSQRGREAREYVERCLEEFKVPRPYAFGVTGGCHQDVRFTYLGRACRYVFPGSPSDRRALKNSRTELRKVLRSTEGKALPAGPQGGPVLDAGCVLPRQLNYVGGSTGRLREAEDALRRCKWPRHSKAV